MNIHVLECLKCDEKFLSRGADPEEDGTREDVELMARSIGWLCGKFGELCPDDQFIGTRRFKSWSAAEQQSYMDELSDQGLTEGPDWDRLYKAWEKLHG